MSCPCAWNGIWGITAIQPIVIAEELPMTTNDKQMDIAAIRARLAASQGKEYWRSLEELAGSEAFLESLRREFPIGAEEWSDAIDRRRFLQLMGASLALAGLTAC